MTKEDFLKLTGREATKYAIEQFLTHKWTRQEMEGALRGWRENHGWFNDIKKLGGGDGSNKTN